MHYLPKAFRRFLEKILLYVNLIYVNLIYINLIFYPVYRDDSFNFLTSDWICRRPSSSLGRLWFEREEQNEVLRRDRKIAIWLSVPSGDFWDALWESLFFEGVRLSVAKSYTTEKKGVYQLGIVKIPTRYTTISSHIKTRSLRKLGLDRVW